MSKKKPRCFPTFENRDVQASFLKRKRKENLIIKEREAAELKRRCLDREEVWENERRFLKEKEERRLFLQREEKEKRRLFLLREKEARVRAYNEKYSIKNRPLVLQQEEEADKEREVAAEKRRREYNKKYSIKNRPLVLQREEKEEERLFLQREKEADKEREVAAEKRRRAYNKKYSIKNRTHNSRIMSDIVLFFVVTIVSFVFLLFAWQAFIYFSLKAMGLI